MNSSAVNDTATVAWFPSPTTRGTWDLFQSCVFTFTLCVSTALHLNVPFVSEGKWKLFLRKAKWVFLGIVAPEVVLYTAIDQWLQARALRTTINHHVSTTEEKGVDADKSWQSALAPRISESTETIEMGPLLEQSQKPSRKRNATKQWGLTECFFAIMGGIAFDCGDISDVHPRVTLSASGIDLLAKHDYTPPAPQKSIEDKSKAGIFAKGFVIVQTFWLVIQCIARKAQNLPISLLEVHTMVHVVCAGMMYIFWFQKPLDVQEPLLLDSDFDEVLALLLMMEENPDRGRGQTRSEIIELVYDPSFTTREGRNIAASADNASSNASSSDPSRGAASARRANPRPRKSNPLERKPINVLERNPINIDREQLQQSGKHIELRANQIDTISGFGFRYFLGDSPEKTYKLTAKDATRWQLAAGALRKSSQLRDVAGFGSQTSQSSEYFITSTRHQKYLFQRSKNIRLPDEAEGTRSIDAFLFLLLPAIYGGVHLAVSGFPFPSDAEDALWYWAGLYITAASPFLMCLFNDYSRTNSSLYFNALLLVWSPIYVPYRFARLYIVVESFLSLRKMPIRVYHNIL